MILSSISTPSILIGIASIAAQTTPESSTTYIKEFLYYSPPWLFLLIGLWIACLLWRNQSLSSIRQSRTKQISLSKRLTAVTDRQAKLLEELSRTFATEKQRWALQVSNRDQLLKDLKIRISRFDKTEANYKETLAQKTAEISGLKCAIAHSINEKETLENELQCRDYEIEALKNDLSPHGRMAKKIVELEDALNRRDQQIGDLTFDHKTAIEAHYEKDHERDAHLADLKQQLESINREHDRVCVEHHALTEKAREIDELYNKLDLLNQQTSDDETYRVELETRINVLELELEEKENALYAFKIELAEKDGVSERSLELENLLSHRNTEVNQLHHDRETIRTELERRISEGESKINELTHLSEQQGNEISYLKSELQVREGYGSKLDELEETLGDRDRDLDYHKRYQIELENRINDLEMETSEKTAKIQILESDLTDKQGARQLLDEVDVILEKRDEEVNQLRSERESLRESLENRISELEETIAARDSEITQFSGNASQSETELANLRREVKKLTATESRISELEEQLFNRDRELERERSDRFSLENRINELESDLNDKNHAIETLETDLKENQGARLKLSEIGGALEDRDSKLNLLRDEREAIKGEMGQRIQELEWLLGERDGELNQLRREAPDKRISELEWYLGERDGELKELRPEKEKRIAAELRIEELEQKLHSVERDREVQIEELEQKLIERVDELETLRPVFKQLEERETEIAALKANSHPFHDDKIVEDAALGFIYTGKPDKIDDLKRINGIAEVLEKKLHEHGVYRFRQIAAWNLEQIKEFGRRLTFKDRIERDQWVAQAIDLHLKDYGEHLSPRIDLDTHRSQSNGNTPGHAGGDATVQIDRLLGPIFTHRPREVDELGGIESLTEHFVERLHHLGIYRFKQIALWNDRQIEHFRRILSVNGNGHVPVDQWVAEAKRLHQEKYNETIEPSNS